MSKYLVLKASALVGLLIVVAWLARAPHWEPAAISVGLLTALVKAEVSQRRSERRKVNPEQLLKKINPEIRRLLIHISALRSKEIQSVDIQVLVEKISYIVSKTSLDKDVLPLPKSSDVRVFAEGEDISCSVCHKEGGDVYSTGHCRRCKFESHSWMQIKGKR